MSANQIVEIQKHYGSDSIKMKYFWKKRNQICMHTIADGTVKILALMKN